MDIRRELQERSKLLDRLDDAAGQQVQEISDSITACLEGGGTVYACGNGGSATQVQHFTAELVGRFKIARPALRAFSLTDNSAVLTSLANDYAFEDVFSRQIEGLSRPGDCLVALSTSGMSPNVVRACKMAKEKGVHVFSMTGASGGDVAEVSDVVIRIPHDDTARIQEGHLVMIHLICQFVEAAIFPAK